MPCSIKSTVPSAAFTVMASDNNMAVMNAAEQACCKWVGWFLIARCMAITPDRMEEVQIIGRVI